MTGKTYLLHCPLQIRTPHPPSRHRARQVRILAESRHRSTSGRVKRYRPGPIPISIRRSAPVPVLCPSGRLGTTSGTSRTIRTDPVRWSGHAGRLHLHLRLPLPLILLHIGLHGRPSVRLCRLVIGSTLNTTPPTSRDGSSGMRWEPGSIVKWRRGGHIDPVPGGSVNVGAYADVAAITVWIGLHVRRRQRRMRAGRSDVQSRAILPGSRIGC